MVNKTQRQKIAKESLILTKRELDVINKKLRGDRLTQQDSNYLSKYVRPKLHEISSIDAATLISKLKYNQRSIAIENKIEHAIVKNIGRDNLQSIILYGSAIQTNYGAYNDIDILIVTKEKVFKNLGDKAKKISELKNLLALHLFLVALKKHLITLVVPVS